MLYIKNGRIYTLSFSFELPEDMSIVTDPAGVAPDMLVMESYDGKYQVEIGALSKDETPQEQLEAYTKYGSHVKMGEMLAVERGEMKGMALLYHTESWSEERYDERLTYPMNEDGQNTLVLSITYEILDELNRNKLSSFMNQPNIKRFIDSIQYEKDNIQNQLSGA